MQGMLFPNQCQYDFDGIARGRGIALSGFKEYFRSLPSYCYRRCRENEPLGRPLLLSGRGMDSSEQYHGVLCWNRYLTQAGCSFIIVTELETD